MLNFVLIELRINYFAHTRRHYIIDLSRKFTIKLFKEHTLLIYYYEKFNLITLIAIV